MVVYIMYMKPINIFVTGITTANTMNNIRVKLV